MKRYIQALPGGPQVRPGELVPPRPDLEDGLGDPVTSIGRAVGWPDQNYFARRFKAHYGLSATTYRKRFAAWAAAHPPGAL
jgi:AraC-like DNA-binding protein